MTRLAKLVAVWAIFFSGIGSAAGENTPGPIPADHHVHLHSPAILAFLPQYCAQVERFGKCDPAFTAPLKVEDLLTALDEAGIGRAVVMSSGYLPESSMLDPLRPDADELMRAANDWTAGLARRYPRRMSAFVAVDPTRATALPEIARWRGDPSVTGIKLHLTASGTDLRKEADLAALAAVFEAAADADLAIAIHLRPRTMTYGAADIRRFLAEVLPAAGDTPVQIAHAGGWGGIDEATLSALAAFADAKEAQPEQFSNVRWDLAGVWDTMTAPSDLRDLAALVRRIGPEYFVVGSDWPFNSDLADYYSEIFPLLPLTPEESEAIRGNVPPYLSRVPAQPH